MGCQHGGKMCAQCFMIQGITHLISDTHFGHLNIIKYCGRPSNHDELMLRNWHDTVGVDDSVLHLGDVLWANKAKHLYRDIFTLPGRKYYLKGNHDHMPAGWYEDVLGFTLVGHNGVLPQQYFGKQIVFSHYPQQAGGDCDINIHGHTHDRDFRSGTFDYRNISVERIGYRPKKLDEVVFLWKPEAKLKDDITE